MYCLNCGYKIVENLKFCPECGSRLVGNTSEEDPHGGQEPGGVAATDPTVRQDIPEFPGLAPNFNGFLGMFNMTAQNAPQSFEEMMRKMNSHWSFEYSVSGMMFRSGVTYRAWKNDDKTITYVQVRLSGVDLKDAPVFEVSNDFAENLERILNENNADAWNGFSGHAEGVMDGDSFMFAFQDGKGRRISASGYMAWPNGFGGARVLWDALFYGEYDKHFPNYAKRLQDYINKTVFPQYGKCKQDVYEVHYIAGTENSFIYSENSMPAGIITYRTGRFTQTRANDDTDKTWIEAALVRSFKNPSEVDPSVNETGLILEVYRSDSEGVRKVLEQRVCREAVIGNDGDLSILFREIDGRTVIGIYRKITYHYGKTYKTYFFTAIDCIGGTWNKLDEACAEIPAREKVFPEEELARYTEVMETVGLHDTAAMFRESKEDFRITEPYTKLLGISWFTNLNPEFPQKVQETEPGKEIKGYWIKISISATDYNFG